MMGTMRQSILRRSFESGLSTGRTTPLARLVVASRSLVADMSKVELAFSFDASMSAVG